MYIYLNLLCASFSTIFQYFSALKLKGHVHVDEHVRFPDTSRVYYNWGPPSCGLNGRAVMHDRRASS